MSPRDFLFVRIKIEDEMRLGCEAHARRAAVDLVDEWATDVIAAHINTSRFPLQVQAEFTVAASKFYFGIIGGGLNQPPDVERWVRECNWIMKDRVRFWAAKSEHFNATRRFEERRAATPSDPA
jgi:hypothetical protein